MWGKATLWCPVPHSRALPAVPAACLFTSSGCSLPLCHDLFSSSNLPGAEADRCLMGPQSGNENKIHHRHPWKDANPRPSFPSIFSRGQTGWYGGSHPTPSSSTVCVCVGVSGTSGKPDRRSLIFVMGALSDDSWGPSLHHSTGPINSPWGCPMECVAETHAFPFRKCRLSTSSRARSVQYFHALWLLRRGQQKRGKPCTKCIPTAQENWQLSWNRKHWNAQFSLSSHRFICARSRIKFPHNQKTLFKKTTGPLGGPMEPFAYLLNTAAKSKTEWKSSMKNYLYFSRMLDKYVTCTKYLPVLTTHHAPEEQGGITAHRKIKNPSLLGKYQPF